MGKRKEGWEKGRKDDREGGKEIGRKEGRKEGREGGKQGAGKVRTEGGGGRKEGRVVKISFFPHDFFFTSFSLLLSLLCDKNDQEKHNGFNDDADNRPQWTQRI